MTEIPTPVSFAAPRRSKLSPASAFALALVALAAALLLRRLLDPFLGDSLPLVTLFGAIAAAVWLGGYLPAIVVAILGYLGCLYWFVPPRGQLTLDRGQMVGLAAYAIASTLIVLLGESSRRSRERERQRSEWFRVTLASVGDAVITTDLEGRVTYMNAVAEALTGWPLAEARGQRLDIVVRVVHEKTREPVENPAARALREGAIVGLANHTVLLRKDGSECPIDDSAAPILNDRQEVQGCVLTFRDVRIQRAAEHERRDQLLTARLLASIIESSDDAIIGKSLDGVIRSWNAAAERVFGHTAEAAIGRHIAMVIPPERISEEAEIVARLSAGERIDHFETERVRADGRRIVVSLTISPIKDESGIVVGASKIARDVTDRRQAEAERQQLITELADANRRKNEFLATLAHELRNPLAPISNATHALRKLPNPDETVRLAAEMLERQVGQMSRLVEDLLDMSRISRGQIELRKQRVELGPVLQHAIEAVLARYRSRNHTLAVHMPDQPVYLDGDPARLAQVVENLLNNGCKFTDKGGTISLTVATTAKEAVLRVRDSGIGIAAENIPRVFGMFEQIDSGTERSRDGLGIGLPLVKSLVELHGGTVEARSEGLGRGSEFVVRLPLPLAVETKPPAVARADATPASARRLILIVDDNHDGAESLAMMLQLIGHETHKAYDGAQALESAKRLSPDVVLLDIGLPKLDGHEVCRRIRSDAAGRNVLLVALTGWGQEEDRRRSKDAGFDAHLVKPVDLRALTQLLSAFTPSEG